MDRRGLTLGAIWLAALLACTPVTAQTPVPPAATPPVPASTPDARQHVILETAAGDVVIALEPGAPATAANFLRYVDERRFDGTDIYRGMEVAPGRGLIQGGTNNAADRILAPIVHEPTSQTGLSHTDGAVSMARYDPGSATGDFFIIVGDVRSLDASAADPGFAVFGRVVDGMDVVRRILAAPKSATEGEGVMRGQMLEPRVRIVSVRGLAVADAASRD